MKNGVRILIASQKEAKLFSYDKEEGFKLIQIYNDAPFNNEIDFTSNSERPHKREQSKGLAVEKDAAQKEDIRHHFVHHVCERLFKDSEKNHFKYLCLFAEAKTLGDLRKYLHKSLLDLVTYEATANLAGESEDQIIQHLKKIGVSEMIKTVL